MRAQRRLHDRLDAIPIPGEAAARDRTELILDAAYAARAGRTPQPRMARRRITPLAATALALTVSAAALAASGQGGAVTRWLGSIISPPPAAHQLARLPTSGRMLALSARGAWLIDADGARHRLGDFTAATWSPHGLFVAGARGSELSAVDPDGNVHWTLTAPAKVADPRWGPDGFRIAYRSGRTLRVVAGDGSGDHVVGRDVAAVAPAWRPDTTHALAFLTPAGRLFLSRVDDGTGRLLANHLQDATWLAWADRHRLLVATPKTLVTIRGRMRRSWHVPAGTAIVGAATSPTVPRVALVLQGVGLSEILLLDARTLRRQRTLLTIHGTAANLTWSPDGRWLTAAQPDTGRWLMIPLKTDAAARAVTGLAAALGAPASRARPVAWCCPRDP